jgi:excisionase family DNA binding protein
MAEIETFYSISDVAHALGVSTKTVDRWIKSGELAAHKVGRQWRISRTDLETFLKLRRCSSRS